MIEEKRFRTEFGDLVYLETGTGKKTLLCLHGFMGTPWIIGSLAVVFNCKNTRIIAPYLPGHGKSFSLPRSFTFTDTVEVLLNFSDEVFPGKISIYGGSLGGGLALALAKKVKSRLDKLILYAPLLRPLKDRDLFWSFLGLMRDYLFDGVRMLRRGDKAWPSSKLRRGFFRRNSLVDLNLVLVRQLTSVRFSADSVDRKKVLFLWGNDDSTLPFKKNKDLVYNVSDKIKFFPSSHAVYLSQPLLFLETIRDFLDK